MIFNEVMRVLGYIILLELYFSTARQTNAAGTQTNGTMSFDTLRSPINGPGNRKIVETLNTVAAPLQPGFISDAWSTLTMRPAIWVKP